MFGWRTRRYSPAATRKRSTACRIADEIGRLRCGQLHHQPDDVPRRAELPVLPGARDLAEHVLVEVPLGVAVLHRHVVEQVHHLGRQCRRRNGEARILHVMRVSRVVSAERPQKREHVLPDDGVHLGGSEVLEARPAQVIVRPAAALADVVLSCWKHPSRHRLAQPGGSVLFERVEIVEPAEEQQIGDLLDDFDGIGDAARPECVPDLVDLTLDSAGNDRVNGVNAKLGLQH
jgi:hypothetical protein